MRTHLFLVPALIAALAGCARQAEAPELAAPADPAAPAAQAAAGQVNCIVTDQIVSRRPEGPRSLRFEMAGGSVYRNSLPGRCPALERASDLDVLTLELQGGQLCSGDSFRVVDPAGARAVGIRAFPECRLGAFVPVEPRR